MIPRTWLLAAACTVAPLHALRAQRFFHSDSVFSFTVRTDFRALARDRDTVNAPWHAATITWAGADGPKSVALRVKTRGAYRLRLCDLPPIRLRFTNDSVRGTPWHDLRRPKLATHCKDRDDYEQNLLHEYTLYRIYQVFTPLSYRIRLVRVTYEDASGSLPRVTRYGFILEDPDGFPSRVHATPLRQPGVRQSHLELQNAALLGVFEYFIGNTDWSVPGLHNVALMRVDSVMRAVPYDFDWSGAVDAPYVRPDPSLPIHAVRQRIYRGLCLEAEDLVPTLARFEALKDSIGAVYRAVPALDPRIVERAQRWYDEFYRAIANRSRFAERVVQVNCFTQ
jgi:hypothetical protein